MILVCGAEIKVGGKLSKAYQGDAGYDVFSVENVKIPARGNKIVSTNLQIALPEGYVAILKSRSGLAFKHNIEVGAGVIDSGYRGEIKVLLRNFGDEDYYVSKGDKIAQLIVFPVADVEWKIVNDLSPSTRGKNGFGSSGK